MSLLRRQLVILAAILVVATLAPPANAYIAVPLQTLGHTVGESTHVMLVRVEKVSREKGIIIYAKVRDLKGKYPKDKLKHVFNMKDPPTWGKLFRPEADDWSYVLHWAEPGKEAVVFLKKQAPLGDFSHTYVDQGWYGSYGSTFDDVLFHTMHTSPEFLKSFYCGSPARLAAAVEKMLVTTGDHLDDPVVPTLDGGTVADLRAGAGKVRGLKAGLVRYDVNLKRDAAAWEDPKAAEALAKRLADTDQAARLRAATELAHWFGPEIKAALPALATALTHADPATRKAAAVALGNIHLDATSAVPALVAALKDADPAVGVAAAGTLGDMRGKAKTAAPALRAEIKAGGAKAEAAAAALIGVDPTVAGDEPAVAALLAKLASIGGKYSNLLLRINAPQDFVARQSLRVQADIVGVSDAAPEFRGARNVPKGYRVYAYPYWYVWSERAETK